MRPLKRNLDRVRLGLALAASLWTGTSQAQTRVALDPAWRVSTVDTNKPGFVWNIFANSTLGNRGTSNSRAEADLAGQSVDSNGDPLPNLADPAAVGAALGPAEAANPANAPVHFEIEGVINLSSVEGGAGNFASDGLEPGAPDTNGGTDSQAAEILTYLTLPVGVITMGVNSDDGFSTASGPNPQDAFGRVELGSFDAGRGSSDTLFEFEVTEAGTYPFRTVWENGGGGSNIEWFTVQPRDGTKVLINDRAGGGIPAYRALAAAAAVPYVKAVNPAAVPRQVEITRNSVSVVLADGASPVNDDSVVLQIDGTLAAVTKQRQGPWLTVNTGAVEGLHLAAEAHTGVLTFQDTSGAYSRTQQWTFYNLENLILPASPVAGENFDSYPEATSEATTVPPGWVAWNYTFRENEGWDLADLKSDAYLNWVLITTDTVLAVEDEVLDNDKTQLINGQPVTNWMSGNLIFVASDGRARSTPEGYLAPQAQFVISKPFDLSSVTNPVLTFSSGARISTANHEQLTTEYSVDGGTNWLPVIYMRNASTARVNSEGAYDVAAMFNTVDTNNIAQFPTPGVGPLGGKWGDMLAAPISQALSPYIAIRNDGVAARRVEAIRLPQASQQSDVRLRLTHLSSCGWEWGVDNIAFYDIAPTAVTAPSIDSIVLSAGQVTIQWSNGGTLESTSELMGGAVWTSTGNSSGVFSEAVGAGNKFYRVRQ